MNKTFFNIVPIAFLLAQQSFAQECKTNADLDNTPGNTSLQRNIRGQRYEQNILRI